MDKDLLDYIPNDEDLEDEELLPTKTYGIDFNAGRITGTIDGVEAMKQATVKALITPHLKCLIYPDYGSEIEEDVVAESADVDYLEAVIPDYVREALEDDDRILDVGDFTINVKDDSAYISFKEDTIYGEIEIEVVI